jgi:dihydropteroate synthase
MILRCGDHALDLRRPRLLGVLNVTPDSFSDGGAFLDPGRALAHAERLVEEGAAAIDVGGESTRPGAAEVGVEQELARVLPVVERLVRSLAVPVSIDTRKPEVMRAAVGAGAALINSVDALSTDGAMEAAASLGVPVCLMHMQGEPRTMQHAPQYADVVEEVRDFLIARRAAALAAGIAADAIVLDPGFGFGKTLAHNLALFAALPRIVALGAPVLVGLSRKRMIGELTGREPPERAVGSAVAAALAAAAGARLLRVHDVAATRDALAVHAALGQMGPVG